MPLQGLLTQIEHALAPVGHVMKPILSDPLVMGVWALLVLGSVGTLWWDVHERNQALPSLMKGVWTLVVLYSGPSIGTPAVPRSAMTRCGGVASDRPLTAIRDVVPAKFSGSGSSHFRSDYQPCTKDIDG